MSRTLLKPIRRSLTIICDASQFTHWPLSMIRTQFFSIQT